MDKKLFAFHRQTGNADRSRSGTCSHSILSTTSVVKDAKGTGDAMGITDATAANAGPWLR
jgi:hypothetical protein